MIRKENGALIALLWVKQSNKLDGAEKTSEPTERHLLIKIRSTKIF